MNGNLQCEHIVPVDCDKRNIEEDCEDLSKYEQLHYSVRSLRVGISEETACVVDIEQWYRRFLDREPGHLNFLHDVHRHKPYVGVRRRYPEIEDYDWSMKQKCICDDHGENCAEKFSTTDHQIKPRVQHEWETRHIPHPADLEQDTRYYPVSFVEKLENQTEYVEYNTPGTDNNGPKIEALVSFEGEEDLNR